MSQYLVGRNGTIDLQASLSAMTAMGDGWNHYPHHPISCAALLAFYEDGALECEHVKVPPGDARTQSAIDSSIALLVMEMAHERFGSAP